MISARSHRDGAQGENGHRERDVLQGTASAEHSAQRSDPPFASAPTPDEQKKQEYYRDARTGGYYGDIWTTVGKCVFCDLREKYIIYEEQGVVLTVALFAYIDGNVMIVPRRHVRSAKELTSAEWDTMRKLMYLSKKLIRQIYGIKGVQYLLRDGGITAQSTVSDHLHMHVVPFDAPDLSVWNYRQLKYTPLENANLFRGEHKTIDRLLSKYDSKYQDGEA